MIKAYYLDDEAHLCEIFREFGEIIGISVECFTEEEDALARISESLPDIFFIDFRLKKTTGDKIAKQIPESVIKIITTGDFLERDHNDLFSDTLQKPFNRANIQAIIEKYCGKN